MTSPVRALDALPASASAPAKLILSGEHAVVYGHPAVAIAVDRWTRVRLSSLADPGLPTCIASTTAPVDDSLRAALTTIVPDHGLQVDIDSTIPIGRGMGSSASLAVALVRARARAQGRTPPEAEVHRAAFTVERVFHGTPSGVDHGVIGRGGAVRFQRTERGIDLQPLACPALPLVVFDSGSAGSTRDLVAGVRARRLELVDTLAALGALTERVIAALTGGAPWPELGALLSHNHTLLRAIGVSTPELDHLVDFACGHGAVGAKLSGAGGGGVVIALAPQPDRLLEYAQQAGLSAFRVAVVPPTGSQP